jgi:hypothetical protein
VYPQANNKQQGITGPYVPSEALRDYEHECATYYVELFDKDELKPRGRIGTDLIDKVICK